MKACPHFRPQYCYFFSFNARKIFSGVIGRSLIQAPQARRIESVRTLTDFIRVHDIDATAYFYTEIEESGMAEQALRNAMAYAHPDQQ